MDTFDGSLPDLISNKMIKNIESRLDVTRGNDNNHVINGLGSIYNNYIAPNLFPIIVVSLLCIYLTIKYVLKKDREEKDVNLPANSKTKKIMFKHGNTERSAGDHDHCNAERSADDRCNSNNNNISDIISDDYLLTDSDNDNSDTSHPINLDNKLDCREPSYDLNRVATLVFGEHN